MYVRHVRTCAGFSLSVRGTTIIVSNEIIWKGGRHWIVNVQVRHCVLLKLMIAETRRLALNIHVRESRGVCVCVKAV